MRAWHLFRRRPSRLARAWALLAILAALVLLLALLAGLLAGLAYGLASLRGA